MQLHGWRSWHFLVIWLVLAAGLVAPKSAFYFEKEHWEGGDAAANGLQIRKAKDFAEIHGNYSRFGFHHPGPGFFYAYAAGEALLYDALKVVPSPHNAHVLVGVLMQTGFFAWTLSILARRIRHRLLVPLTAIVAALHFGAANYNIPHSLYESIWPPHVLLFPFLCFLVACASIASGAARDALAAIAAGCLLVHGHVAQPLFVLPMFAVSCTAFILHLRSKQISLGATLRGSWRSLLGAGVVLAIFIAPLAFDAARGSESNIARIMKQIEDSSGDRKTLLQSLNYLGTFLCYVPDPERFCDRLTSESLGYAKDRWYLLAGWMLLITTIVIAYPRSTRDSRFVRALYWFFALGVLLLIRWGVMQSGPMLAFNSHFAYGLLLVPMVLAALALCRKISPDLQRRARPVALTIALPLFMLSAHDWGVWPPFSEGPVYDELAAHAKTEPHRKKFLRFPDHDWPWALGCALALRRLGMDYRVENRWGFMFGYKKTAKIAAVLRSNEMQVWDLGVDPAKRTGFAIRGGPFVGTLPPPLDPRGSEIRFNGDEPNAAEFAATGWEVTGGPFSFSTAKTAVLYFQPGPTARDVEMKLDVFPATFPDRPTQRMLISIGREPLHEVVAHSDVTFAVMIPAALWQTGQTATIVFDFPDAASPREMGVSDDERRLGFGFRTITFRELPQP